MKSIWKWTLFGGYTLITIVLFLYLLFPEETIKEYAQNRVIQMQPDLSVTIDTVRPSFPPGLRFKAVSLQHAGKPLLAFSNIRFSPELSTLFTKNPAYRFLAAAYDGSIKGRIREYPDASDAHLSAHARIQDIDIGKLFVSKTLSKFSIGGRLNGEILLNKDHKEQVDVNAQLEIEEATVELDAPLIFLKTLSFKKIQTDLKMRSRTLIIRQLSVKGPQMDGRISGSIFLSGDLKQSVLNLTGKIKPNHLLLAAIGKGFQSLLSSAMKREQDGISFRINETIEKPAFSFTPS